jgi:hypothetical protein
MRAGNKTLIARFIGLSVALSGCFAVHTAFAALGGSPLTGADPHVASSVMTHAAEAKALTASQVSATDAASAAAAAAAHAAYSVNVVTLTTGTVVREFVATSSNTVFALTWSGSRPPNFADILGPYADRYLKKPAGADVIRVGGLRQRGLSSSDLVVESFGHYGQFSGYAYLPSAVPAGLSLTDIQ